MSRAFCKTLFSSFLIVFVGIAFRSSLENLKQRLAKLDVWMRMTILTLAKCQRMEDWSGMFSERCHRGLCYLVWIHGTKNWMKLDGVWHSQHQYLLPQSKLFFTIHKVAELHWEAKPLKNKRKMWKRLPSTLITCEGQKRKKTCRFAPIKPTQCLKVTQCLDSSERLITSCQVFMFRDFVSKFSTIARRRKVQPGNRR